MEINRIVLFLFRSDFFFVDSAKFFFFEYCFVSSVIAVFFLSLFGIWNWNVNGEKCDSMKLKHYIEEEIYFAGNVFVTQWM